MARTARGFRIRDGGGGAGGGRKRSAASRKMSGPTGSRAATAATTAAAALPLLLLSSPAPRTSTPFADAFNMRRTRPACLSAAATLRIRRSRAGATPAPARMWASISPEDTGVGDWSTSEVGQWSFDSPKDGAAARIYGGGTDVNQQDGAAEDDGDGECQPISSVALYYPNDLSTPCAVNAALTDVSAVATVLDPDDPESLAELVEAERAYVDPAARSVYSKLFNAALLSVSFGFVLYTLVNVDAGMTRGWTQQEIAMRLPLDAWTSYESSLAEKPVLTKTVINVVIYLLGDWLSQTIFLGTDVLDFDAARTLRNGFIGMCFGPLVHQYYDFSDWILPVDVGMNRVYKILMDQTIYLLVKCSIYLMAVSVLAGETWEKSWNDTKGKIGGVMTTAWKFWPLVHCITYTVIPAPHRVLWVNSVDLVWNAILATKATGSEEEEEEGGEDGWALKATEAVTAAAGSFVNGTAFAHPGDSSEGATKSELEETDVMDVESIAAIYDVGGGQDHEDSGMAGPELAEAAFEAVELELELVLELDSTSLEREEGAAAEKNDTAVAGVLE